MHIISKVYPALLLCGVMWRNFAFNRIVTQSARRLHHLSSAAGFSSSLLPSSISNGEQSTRYARSFYFHQQLRQKASKRKSDENGYGADQITVLEGLDPVRKRPGMYIGSTGPDGLHHLVFEVVDNSIDEALAGHCTKINVHLHADGSVTVRDDGRGIPCDIHPTTGKSTLETVMTVLHAGGKFGGDSSGYQVSGGLHGVGVSVVNALSEWTEVTVRRLDSDRKGSSGKKSATEVTGQEYTMRFERGLAVGEIDIKPFSAPKPPKGKKSTTTGLDIDESEIVDGVDLGAAPLTSAAPVAHLEHPWSATTGTTIRFKPDEEIFQYLQKKAAGGDSSDGNDGNGGDSSKGWEAGEGASEVVQKKKRGKQSSSPFVFERIGSRLNEFAYLNAGVFITLTQDEKLDEKHAKDPKENKETDTTARAEAEAAANSAALATKLVKSATYYHRGGLAEYLTKLCEDKTPLFSFPTRVRSKGDKDKDAAGDAQDFLKSLTYSGNGQITIKASLPLPKKLQRQRQQQIEEEMGGAAAAAATVAEGGDGEGSSGSGSSGGAGAGSTASQRPLYAEVEIVLRWSSDQYSESVISFANGIKTSDGGTHVEGFRTSLTRTINQLAKKLGKIPGSGVSAPGGKPGGAKAGGAGGGDSISGEYLREGLTAVVSVKLPEAEFEGQTKNRLGNVEMRSLVDQSLSSSLQTVFEWHPKALNAILEKAMGAQSAAMAARAARDLVRRKSLLTSSVLPGKLADCSAGDPREGEIFLVEGDSAAGSAKQGRDRRTQAVLPLRGKILNIEKAAPEKIYQNTELQAMISALGLGVKGASDFTVDSLRYHKIVIMTDADVDGAHIRTLLLTFFWRYQPELVDGGFIYVACPPLYKFTGPVLPSSHLGSATGGKPVDESDENDVGGGGSAGGKANGKRLKLSIQYAYTQEEMDEYMDKLAALVRKEEARGAKTAAGGALVSSSSLERVKSTLQRFKGLGEMMPLELWETTMDPTTRIFKKVTAVDGAQADFMFRTLMGDNPATRKEFINTNAAKLELAELDF